LNIGTEYIDHFFIFIFVRVVAYQGKLPEIPVIEDALSDKRVFMPGNRNIFTNPHG